MKQKRWRGKKTVKPHTTTKAVPHIRLLEANSGKLAALDALAPVYLALCQQYTTLFCTNEAPNKLRTPLFQTPLSERWHRVAIQQAAGISQSWWTNRAQAYQDYMEELEEYREQKAEGSLKEGAKEPQWREWDVPTLRQICIQANVNVVKLQPSEDSTFDYWLQISTLELRKPLLVPVKLADYHRQALEDKTINSSVQLNKRADGWWLTLSYDELVMIQTEVDAPVVGIDVGITNFLTTSDGKHYGSYHKKLKERHRRDREKRRRKAKLRACLKKKGVQKLPSTSGTSSQRLSRHVRQEINRAVNQCFDEHPDAQLAYEQLSVASMKFKARSMNAYLYASNLGHLPKQIEWNATKRGRRATKVKSAYSSQQCQVCSYTHRKNRPDQQTFCCQVCRFQTHADTNASQNLATRLHDEELRACSNRQEVKALLLRRHESWKQQFGLVVVQPAVQLGLWDIPKASTDVA